MDRTILSKLTEIRQALALHPLVERTEAGRQERRLQRRLEKARARQAGKKPEKRKLPAGKKMVFGKVADVGGEKKKEAPRKKRPIGQVMRRGGPPRGGWGGTHGAYA